VRIELMDQTPLILVRIHPSEMMDFDVMFYGVDFQEVNAAHRVHLIPRFFADHTNWWPHRQLPWSTGAFTWEWFWCLVSCVYDGMMVLDLGRWHAPVSVRLD
jgi:hypothetical protein